MTQPLVSIIIVNWNGKDFLPACLDSIKEQVMKDFEVIVVDNASHDGSVELLKRSYPWVKVVPLDFNTGFATGNNAGLAPARGKYVITLNNDTRVDACWLAELVAVAEEHPDVGMVASRICSWDDHDTVDSLGVRICADGMSRGNQRLSSFSSLAVRKVEEILFPSACAALYRRSMINETGFFDDDFFAYCEDTDLGLRGRLAGWGALLARDAIVYHRYSCTGGVFSPFKLYLVERNHFWVTMKNFPFNMLLLLPFWTAVRYLVQAGVVISGRGAGGQFLKSSPFELVTSILRGIRDACIALPSILAKRKKNMAISRISSAEMERLLKRYRMTFRELLDAG